MIELPKLNHTLAFPSIHNALEEPNGLLAFGGDLSVERLLRAYQQGIFPWFSEGEPILWWSPDPRGLLLLDDYHCSRSLAKFQRKTPHRCTLNHCFDDVIDLCASVPRDDQGTWITHSMRAAYRNLHQAGHAHSLEVWNSDGDLVGGLYGINVGRVFCGESMFSQAPNGSKLAMHYLVKHMRDNGGQFIDCQMQTEHLRSLGCKTFSRIEFSHMLNNNTQQAMHKEAWRPQVIRELQ